MNLKVERGRSHVHGRSAGKGSFPRPVNGDKYRSNHERIFGRKRFNSQKFKHSHPPRAEEYSCIMLPPS